MLSPRRAFIITALAVSALTLPGAADAQTVQVDVQVRVHIDGAGQLAPPPAPGEPVTPAPAAPAPAPAAQPVPVVPAPGTLVPAYAPPPLRLQQPMQGPVRMQRPRRSYGLPISMIAAGAVATAMSSMVYAIEESYSYSYDNDHRRILIATGVGAVVFAAGIGLLIHRIRRYRSQRAAYQGTLRAAAW
ncbi:MAG: hypothetical protein AAF411_23520 [Myxococcota bacterium]